MSRRGESAMQRRSSFVSVVAETIRARHRTEGESFVFGLSGRWGEGKSHFLAELRVLLEQHGFEVIELNPWKYSGDRVAFLRAFLLQLLQAQSYWSRVCTAYRMTTCGQYAHAWAMVMPRRHLLASLRMDITKQRISFPRLLLLLGPLLVGYWFYSHDFTAQLTPLVDALRFPIVMLLIPVSVWLIQGLVNSQTSSKATTAVDEFDRLVSAALGMPSGQGRSVLCRWGERDVVVFVDDLDRVTADVARGVLDNLRTFFDKPSLSFVVTGDHSVLEASLGRELAPSAEPPSQIEEGRRFMRKVFNLYWRLPRPVRSDFESFVDQQLKLRDTEIRSSLIRDSEEILRKWLLDYCETNPRLVLRTLDMLLFTLQLIEEQSKVAPPDEVASLQEILAKPMLLGRVLLLQDRCAPLFEMLVEAPSLLIDMDRTIALSRDATSRGGDPPDRKVVDKLTAGLTPEQERFFASFSYEPPLFYDLEAGGQVVSHPGPWIHLAGDLGFKDASGPTPEDFVRDIANLNGESLSAAMQQCSEAKADAAAKAAVAAIAEGQDVSSRQQQALLLLSVTAAAPVDAPLALAVADAAFNRLEQLIVGLDVNQYVDLVVALLRCVDGQQRAIPEAAQVQLAFRDAASLAYLPREAFGEQASIVVVKWLVAMYGRNANECLTPMVELVPHIMGENAQGLLRAIGPQLVDDLMNDNDSGRRDVRLQLLSGWIPGGLAVLKDAVVAAVSRDDIWAWATTSAPAAVENLPWTSANLEDGLLDWVITADSDLLHRVRYACGKLDSISSRLWSRLLESRAKDLQDLLGDLVSDSSLSGLAVPQEVATAVYLRRVELVDRANDEATSIELAASLAPGSWFWESLDRKAARRSLRPMAFKRARRAQLRDAVRPHWEDLASTTDNIPD